MAQPRPRSVLADRLSVPAVRDSGRRARPRALPRPARPASLLAALIVRVDRAPPLRLLAGPRTGQAATSSRACIGRHEEDDVGGKFMLVNVQAHARSPAPRLPSLIHPIATLAVSRLRIRRAVLLPPSSPALSISLIPVAAVSASSSHRCI